MRILTTMKKFILTVTLIFLCFLAKGGNRTCIDGDWQFFLGDGSNALTNLSLTSSWRHLDLPHDWSVETEAADMAGGSIVGPFSSKSIGGYQTGFTVGGEGWYYKPLEFSADNLNDQHIELYFEGAYNDTEVYLNGQLLYNNVYGYQTFRVNISGQVHKGTNHLFVRVRNEGNNTRWYAGSGIYRHVWLVCSPSLYADPWDTYLSAESSRVAFSTTIHNEFSLNRKAEIIIKLKDAVGKTIQTKTVKAVLGGKTQNVKCALTIPNPQLWSLESPYMYKAEIITTDTRTQVSDTLTTRFGVRKLHFSATEGFLLNDSPTLLRGGCIHHDNGLLGAAAYDAAELRKLKLLKAQGYNAIRCSHNLPSESLLNMCDSLGILVIDEVFDQWHRKKNADDYSRHFRKHSVNDIQTMVRRDRNHPSIIMWSIGNEIPGRIGEAGLGIADRLRKSVLQLDTTRPITAAICSWDEGDEWNSAGRGWDIQDEKAFLSLDVGGYNYLYDKYEHDHATHPDRVMCGTESYPNRAAQNWDLVERLPYVIGDFVWTAMDYLGEAGIGSAAFRTKGKQSMFQPWPWYNGWCGDIDLIGQKKPQSYYRDVVWHLKPITMATARLAPAGMHESVSWWGWPLEQQTWTYPDIAEGTPLKAVIYSRAAKVRLYLNDSIIGEKNPSDTYQTDFTLPYRRGTLRAVNLNPDGKEISGEEFILQTTGKPTDIRTTSDKEQLAADGADLAYVTIELVDAKGRVITCDSDRRVRISVEGAGTLLAAGNASPNDMSSFRSSSPRLYNGRALAIIKSSRQKGEIRVMVESDGLPTTIKHLQSK